MHGGDKAQNKRSLKRDRVAGEGEESESWSAGICHTWNRLVLPNPSKEAGGSGEAGGGNHNYKRGETKWRRTRAVSSCGFFLFFSPPRIFHLQLRRVEKCNSRLLFSTFATFSPMEVCSAAKPRSCTRRNPQLTIMGSTGFWTLNYTACTSINSPPFSKKTKRSIHISSQTPQSK